LSSHVSSITLKKSRTRSRRAYLVSALGPLAATAGFVWALLQPYRVTLLHPAHQSFWWLVAEPPLLVIAAGTVFSLVVARPLLADLEESDGTAR
jgi:hypothetical protein